jgi:hypothetical protein
MSIKRYEVELYTNTSTPEFKFMELSQYDRSFKNNLSLDYYIVGQIHTDPNMTMTRISGKVYVANQNILLLPIYILIVLAGVSINYLCGIGAFLMLSIFVWWSFLINRNKLLKLFEQTLRS